MSDSWANALPCPPLAMPMAPMLRRSDTVLRKALYVERRVAVTLWCLVTTTEYWTIAYLFGITCSTVCEIVHETCHCIVDVLMKDYINFPNGDRLDHVVDEFKMK